VAQLLAPSAGLAAPGDGPLTEVTGAETFTDGAGDVLTEAWTEGSAGVGAGVGVELLMRGTDGVGSVGDVDTEGTGTDGVVLVLVCGSVTAGGMAAGSDGALGAASEGACSETAPSGVPRPHACVAAPSAPSSAAINGSPTFALPGDVILNPQSVVRGSRSDVQYPDWIISCAPLSARARGDGPPKGRSAGRQSRRPSARNRAERPVAWAKLHTLARNRTTSRPLAGLGASVRARLGVATAHRAEVARLRAEIMSVARDTALGTR
jgi:hypothetical protein